MTLQVNRRDVLESLRVSVGSLDDRRVNALGDLIERILGTAACIREAEGGVSPDREPTLESVESIKDEPGFSP